MIDIEELKRKALAAHGGLDAWYNDGQMDDLDPADAEYVVTASPKTVLSLIDRLEAAERDLKQIKFAVHEFLGWPLVAEIVAEGDPSENAAIAKGKA